MLGSRLHLSVSPVQDAEQRLPSYTASALPKIKRRQYLPFADDIKNHQKAS